MKTIRSSAPRPARAASRRALPAGAVLAGLFIGTPVHGQDAMARIDSIFGFATAATPGCAVGVSQHGRVIANRAYGLADVERRAPLTERTVFDIGSVQKQFTAASILLLAEDGRLTLSDDIRTHLPELPDYGHRITIDHLLTHTSGIRDWPGMLAMVEEGTDVLQLILRQSGINFVPGDEMSYSNSGYELLKEIVARVSGTTFAEFTRRRLFEPLGMTSSAYVADILQSAGERALAYQKDGADWKQHMRLGNERGSGAVISNAHDLLIWNDALTHGRLGAFVTAKLHEPATLNNGRTLSYARGLMLDTEIPGGPMVWHSGGAAGYGTFLARFTGEGLSVATLCNFEPVSATNLAGRVADLFLPPVDPASDPTPKPAPGVDVSGRAGLFFADGSGEPLRLVVNGGRLSIAGGPPLVPVSAERFLPPRASLMYRSGDRFELVFRSADEFEFTSMEGETARYRRAQPYTPAAAELQALDGRYHSADFGQTFEIVSSSTGRLVWRFESAPERVIELQPVARDTYMQNMTLVRFRRDARGNVIGFDWSNPVLRNVRFTRVAGASTPGR